MSDFFSALDNTKDTPIKEKVEQLSEFLEKIMSIVLEIPVQVDKIIQDLANNINRIEGRVNTIQNEVTQLKARGVAPAGGPGGAPAPPPPPGGGPPPPPGGAPPPPPGGAPANNAPVNPMSLRGAIMGELKSLLARRKNMSDEE
jgi:hypothetical protein